MPFPCAGGCGKQMYNPNETCTNCQAKNFKLGLKKPAQVQAPVVQTAIALEYRGKGAMNWAPNDPTKHILVRKGTEVDLRLMQGTQALAPMWQGATSGAPAKAKFDTASTAATDFKEVKASHNNITYTLKALVYELTPTLAPEDNTGNAHSANSVGVNEKVDLSFQLKPTGVSAADIGGLVWEVLSDKGAKISGGRAFEGKLDAQATQGNAKFQAPYRTETSLNPGLVLTTKDRAIKLRLKTPKGFIKDDHVDLDITVVSPRAHMKIDTTKPHGGIIHRQGLASAGFFGDVFLFPKDVSFKWIRWQEQFGTSSTTGNWPWKTTVDGKEKAEMMQHKATSKTAGADMEVLAMNSATGCKVNQTDNVWSKGNPPTPLGPDEEQGAMDWRILWQYRPADLTNEPAPNATVSTWVTFQVMHHKARAFKNGKMIVSKTCEACGDSGAGDCNGRVERAMGAANDNLSDL